MKGKTSMKEKKKFRVIMNPELERALKGYRPEFGNERDINIVKSLDTLHADLETVDNEVLRGISKSGKKVKLNEKMKRIIYKERGLIASIISRNMDF